MADEFVLDPERALRFQTAFRKTGKSDRVFELLCGEHTLAFALAGLEQLAANLKLTIPEVFTDEACLPFKATPHSMARLRIFFKAHPEIVTLYDLTQLTEKYLLSEPNLGRAVVDVILVVLASYQLRLRTP